MDQTGAPSLTAKKRTQVNTIDEAWAANGETEAAAERNTTAASYDDNHFKALLYDWIISDNVAFNQLESEKFRSLLVYLNPRCKESIPHGQTARRTIGSSFDKVLGVVTEQLSNAVTKINFSFDLWTSKTNLAILGVCAHYINSIGKPVTSLLALPRQQGAHTGVNISDALGSITAQYNLTDKIGYFTTDNASSNDTCLQQLAKEYHFEPEERWIRCSGHIFNLVGQAALLGSSSAALPQAVEDCITEESELRHWRLRGPIGKLHNLVYWINRSPQRCDRFLALQRELITPAKPEDKQDTYQLIKDVQTRWNSFYDSAQRAVYLRPAIDELLMQERLHHNKYVARCEQSDRPIQQKRPAILDDVLFDDDWSVITQYIERHGLRFSGS